MHAHVHAWMAPLLLRRLSAHAEEYTHTHAHAHMHACITCTHACMYHMHSIMRMRCLRGSAQELPKRFLHHVAVCTYTCACACARACTCTYTCACACTCMYNMCMHSLCMHVQHVHGHMHEAAIAHIHPCARITGGSEPAHARELHAHPRPPTPTPTHSRPPSRPWCATAGVCIHAGAYAGRASGLDGSVGGRGLGGSRCVSSRVSHAGSRGVPPAARTHVHAALMPAGARITHAPHRHAYTRSPVTHTLTLNPHPHPIHT